MKRAIFTLNIGNNPMYAPTLKSIEDYAKRIGVDFYMGTEMKLSMYNFYFEKLQCLKLFNEGYDQVLYIDADVLITPEAENIFDQYSSPSTFYAHHESADSEAMDRDPFVVPLSPEELDWPKINGKYRYFNAGIMLFGSEVWQSMLDGILSPPNNKAVWEFGDQTFLNYLSVKNKVSFESLSKKFNWMNCGNDDPDKKRFTANFIHYAGPCLYGGTKEEVIARDYKELYNEDSSV